MVTAQDQEWTGRSDEIAVPLLGAEFWKDGTEVSGILEGRVEHKWGVAFRLTLDSAVFIGDEEVEVVEVSPSLTGVKNALQALKEKNYKPQKGDLWRVSCVGIKKAKKTDYSDSPEFEIGVIRKAAA